MSEYSSNSNGSTYGDDSSESDATSPDHELETLKETLTEETEAFAKKLMQVVKAFINRTTTSRDEVRAMSRCLNKCIQGLDSSLMSEGITVDESVVPPVADVSEERNTDQHRATAKELLMFLKNHTLENYLTALHPLPTTARNEALRALRIIRSQVRGCDNLIDRVMYEGYNCITTSDDEFEEDEDEEDDDEEDDD